jgi:hypothetical protein
MSAKRLDCRQCPRGGLPRYKLTVGELFPADDLVAQWVFSLTSLAEDLTILTPLLNRDDMREKMWFYRQLITRLLEARRLVQAHEDHREIAEFTAPNGLKFGSVDLAAAYARPSVHERSAVEKLYADSRNRTVHYSKVGEPRASRTPTRLPLAAGKDDHVRRRRGPRTSADRVPVGHRYPSSGRVGH